MAAGITLWGRNKHDESLQAIAFLRRHGFMADRLLDLDREPPNAAEAERIGIGLGGTLAPLANTGVEPPGPEWFHDDPRRFRAPILLTPKGALIGFREHAWARFFEVQVRHDGS